MSIPDCLYLITGRKATPPRLLAERVARAIEGGVRLVQLREKDLNDADLLALARDLRAVCTEGGARLLINRRFSVMCACDADGLHVGAAEIPQLSDFRRRASQPLLIGVSTHSLSEARAAEAAGADFVTLGPVYETPSKAGMGSPLGPEEVGNSAKILGIPVFALGGVTAPRIPELRRFGLDRVALIRAVLAADDPARAARDLIDLLKRTP